MKVMGKISTLYRSKSGPVGRLNFITYFFKKRIMVIHTKIISAKGINLRHRAITKSSYISWLQAMNSDSVRAAGWAICSQPFTPGRVP